MKLLNIQFEAYKSFPGKQTFEIRPITIVIGKNSSGKSALCRIPLLISNSFASDSEEPITVNHNDVEFGGSFIDLIHNKYPHGSLNITLSFSENIIISFEVQNIANTPIQMIKRWTIKSDLLALSLEIELTDENALKTENIKYFDGKKIYYITFKGLIPIAIDTVEDEDKIDLRVLDLLTSQLNQFAREIEYIGPYRQIPKRIYFNSGKYPNKLGVKGENAPQVLGTSSYRDESLINEVGDWFERYLGGWKVEVLQGLNSFEVVLISPHDPSVKINIVDVGQGMSQILPLIVRCKSKNHSDKAICIIEQPELHLHPAAHGDLAELFAITAKSEGSSFILETHSENIILRIRRLVTQGILTTDDVIIYWIDDDDGPGSKMKEILINEDGDLSDWPKGVFSEDLEEVLAIREAQRKKNVGTH